ncbi:MAG: hypothetical protein KDN05_02820 [Verrucomicrobiae bacterium]|nr:hypothetical protein [Verrucomicrobiae bacterium]
MGWLTGSRGIRTATDESFSGIRVREFSRGGLRKDTRQGMSGNPKRRLRGFLISTCEGQARVGFVQDDNTIVQYLLPEKNLRKAGITAINQPFEMDEIEQQVGDGFLSGYVFRPMAAADAVVTDTFDADDDLAELRNAALRHFRGKAED